MSSTTSQIVTMFYEGWGMRCCGDPIFVGDVLEKYDVAIIDDTFEGSEIFKEADFYSDNHGCPGIPDEKIRFLSGKVLGIREVWDKDYGKVNHIIDVDSAGDRYISPGKEWSLHGYLIQLELTEIHRCEHGSMVVDS